MTPVRRRLHVRGVLNVFYVGARVAGVQMTARQNLTVQLDRETIRKAKVLAAKRGMSVSAMVAAQIRESVQVGDAYEAARRSALEMIKQGFHLGGGRLNRDDLHER
jgi:hypothetical protein